MRLDEISVPILEGVYDPNIFKVVFMAGAPGAGKTSVATALFSHTGLRTLNIDNFWEFYQKRNQEHDFKKYDNLLGKQQQNYIDGRLGLLIDGTARNPERMAKMKAALEAIGYETALVFVNSTLETSLDRAITREQNTGRHVDPQFIKDAWEQTQSNLGKLQSMFRGNFFIVDNDSDSDLSYTETILRTWLNKKPETAAAADWSKIQMLRKNTTDRMPTE